MGCVQTLKTVLVIEFCALIIVYGFKRFFYITRELQNGTRIDFARGSAYCISKQRKMQFSTVLVKELAILNCAFHVPFVDSVLSRALRRLQFNGGFFNS